MPHVDALFPDVIDNAAFLDTLWVNILDDGTMSIAQEVLEHKGVLCSPGRRSSHAYQFITRGRCNNGNPYIAFHGRRFASAPPMRLRIDSECRPLTPDDVYDAAAQVAGGATRLEVSALDLTFDLTFAQATPAALALAAFTSKYRPKMIYAYLTTMYIGTPKSPWQARIYTKPAECPFVCRLEFAFRRDWLKPNGIGNLRDVSRLREVDLKRLVTFRDRDVQGIRAACAARPPSWKWDFLGEYRYGHQLQERLLRQIGIDTVSLFNESPLNQLIREMQKRFAWVSDLTCAARLCAGPRFSLACT